MNHHLQLSGDIHGTAYSESAAAAVKVPGDMLYRRQRIRRMLRNRWLYLMLLPGILYFLIFKYVPMYGVLIAFKNYQPFLGFWIANGLV